MNTIAVAIIACDDMHTLEVAIKRPVLTTLGVQGTLPLDTQERCTDCGAQAFVMDTLEIDVPNDFPDLDTYRMHTLRR